MQQVPELSSFGADRFEIEVATPRPLRDVITEVLKNFTQCVTRILRPVRTEAGHTRILFQQIANVGSVVRPHGFAGETSRIGHPVFRDRSVRQSRSVLVAQSRRLNGPDLKVNLQSGVDGPINELPNESTELLGQVVRFSRRVS